MDRMSDLPERIWFSIGNGVPKYSLSYYKFLGATEFIRADLAPAVGYSREQMTDALRHFIGPARSIDVEHYMNSLTPAAEVVGSSDVVDLQAVRDQLEIQGRDGNWNYDQYMAGMYNGLECALATLEDREPEYRKLPTPEAKMLDLSGLERLGFVEDSTWYNCIQPKEDGDYVRYSDLTDKLLPPAIGYSRESLREALLDGSMPMIASKMSKSGESEAVEYVPLESVLDAILRLIGSTEKKIIK